MLTLKNTVNSMVDQLNTFASEVTRVALEVGSMGILGGQAKVEGVQGTWADLTRNVNVSECVSGVFLRRLIGMDGMAEHGFEPYESSALDRESHDGRRAW